MEIKQGLIDIAKHPISISLFTIICTISLHYMLTRLYISLCISQGIFGIVTHILYMGNPMCQTINYIQFHISTWYISYLVIISANVIAYITKTFTMQKQ